MSSTNDARALNGHALTKMRNTYRSDALTAALKWMQDNENEIVIHGISDDDFGEYIKLGIELLGLTQSELARLLDVTPTCVNLWVKNKSFPAKLSRIGAITILNKYMKDGLKKLSVNS